MTTNLNPETPKIISIHLLLPTPNISSLWQSKKRCEGHCCLLSYKHLSSLLSLFPCSVILLFYSSPLHISRSVAPMNTQLWTVGGSKAQGKNMKKKCTELEFLVLWLLTCYMFMILGKSLLGASAHLQQNLTEQLQHTNGKIHVRRPRKLPDSISSSLLRKFSIKNLEGIKRMSRWAWLYWFSCMDSADSDTLNSALCLVSFTTDLNVERKKKEEREGRQAAAWEETNLLPPIIQLSGIENVKTIPKSAKQMRWLC